MYERPRVNVKVERESVNVKVERAMVEIHLNCTTGYFVM